MIRITRKVEFSAAHFYHNPSMTAEENKRVFGKCNNPHGHGHNYVLEVTIAGEPDPTTGMVLDLKELKDILQRVSHDSEHRHIVIDDQHAFWFCFCHPAGLRKIAMPFKL